MNIEPNTEQSKEDKKTTQSSYLRRNLLLGIVASVVGSFNNWLGILVLAICVPWLSYVHRKEIMIYQETLREENRKTVKIVLVYIGIIAIFCFLFMIL